MEKMYIIDSIIQQEKARNLQMQEEYQKMISGLPQGSLLIRKLGNREYCYLHYKKNGKVYNQYAGTVQRATEIRELITKRKHFENILNNLQSEYKRIEAMEKVK